jgi:hypothetical protein
MERHLTKLVVIVFIALYFTGCKDSGGSSSSVDLNGSCEARFDLAGRWFDVEGNALDVGVDCYGQESYCELRYKWHEPAGGKILIEINSTNKADGCIQETGEYICDFEEGEFSDSYGDTFEYLQFNCGEGISRYYRSKI